MIPRNDPRNDFGNPINVLKHGNSKQIDKDVFIPLYEYLNKTSLDENRIIERINTANIPDNIKKIDYVNWQLGKIWEEFLQTELRKFVTINPHLKYFDNRQDQKKFVSMSNGSFLIKENSQIITEFDGIVLYRNRHPIIVEIKSSTRKGSGTAFGSGHYQFKMKIAKEIFSDYDEPFFLKIRASEDNCGVGLTSRFLDHRKIAMAHSPMMTGLKHTLGRARFK